jgi:hypothetical protein
MAPAVSVSYTCSTRVSGDVTNAVNASAVGPAGDTVTASASATVSMTGTAEVSRPGVKTPNSHSANASSGSTVAVPTLSVSGLRVTVSGKTVTLHLTTTPSDATVLDLLLLNSTGHTLTRWVIRAKKGTNALSLLLRGNARKPGHDRLTVTEAGTKKPTTIPLTIKA